MSKSSSITVSKLQFKLMQALTEIQEKLRRFGFSYEPKDFVFSSNNFTIVMNLQNLTKNYVILV